MDTSTGVGNPRPHPDPIGIEVGSQVLVVLSKISPKPAGTLVLGNVKREKSAGVEEFIDRDNVSRKLSEACVNCSAQVVWQLLADIKHDIVALSRQDERSF